MNLNDAQFNGTNQKQNNNRNRDRNRKSLKIVLLQSGDSRGNVAGAGKRKSSEQGNSSTGHFSITATSNTNTSTSCDECGIIIAITEGRGESSCEVGLSAMNTQNPELTLFQISDTSSYLKVLNKIYILNPYEILVPITMTQSRLVDALKKSFPRVKIVAVDRCAFRKNSGLEFVKNACAPHYNSVHLMILHKYYALAATGALKLYLETYKRSFYAKESIKVNYSESDFNTMIDIFTADKLELVACALENTHNSSNKRQSSLRGILNHCVTKLGSRMLRSNILQPPNRQDEIENRLNCVEELVKSPEKLLGLREILKKLSNFGQVLSLASLIKTNAQYCDERQMNYILQLNSFFDEMEPLKELLANSISPFFLQVHQFLFCDEFRTLNQLFKCMIHEDARPAVSVQAKATRCFAVKNGQCDILDILRKKYSNRLDDMTTHVDQWAKSLGLDLKLNNNAKKGYHIALQFAQKHQRHSFKKSSLPPDFCQIDIMSTMVTMKTIKLLTLSNRLEDTETEILRISNFIVHELLLQVQKRISQFYKICEHIATLDVLQSLAQASSSGIRYVRPNFDTFTSVIDGRHPLLDYLLETEPVSNNIIVTPENRMHIITGPNGSGKSIYIRQIVLLQIMAQVGCFVPATSATFKICDRILARIYFEDNIECGASAFILEMKEIKYFFNVISDKTLIIIDELCRSTAVREGTALAMSICEHLMKTEAFVYFTTHYTYITNLQQLYPNIRCWQLETNQILRQNSRPRLQFTYRVLPGVITLESYGIALAHSIWPDEVTNDVEELLPKIVDKSMNTLIDKRLALKINLESELQELKRRGKFFKKVVYIKCLEYQDALSKLGVDISFKPKDNNIEDEEEPILPEAVYSLSEDCNIEEGNNLNYELECIEEGDSNEKQILKSNLNATRFSNANTTSLSKFTETSYLLYKEKFAENQPLTSKNNNDLCVVHSTIDEVEEDNFLLNNELLSQPVVQDVRRSASNLFNYNLSPTSAFAIPENLNVFQDDVQCIQKEKDISYKLGKNKLESFGSCYSSRSFHKKLPRLEIGHENVFKDNAFSFTEISSAKVRKIQKDDKFVDTVFSRSFPNFEPGNNYEFNGFNSTFTHGISKFNSNINFCPFGEYRENLGNDSYNSGQLKDTTKYQRNIEPSKSIGMLREEPKNASQETGFTQLNVDHNPQKNIRYQHGTERLPKNTSISSIIASGNFMMGVQRENASTPLPPTTREATGAKVKLSLKKPIQHFQCIDFKNESLLADRNRFPPCKESYPKESERGKVIIGESNLTATTESNHLVTYLTKNVLASGTGTTDTKTLKTRSDSTNGSTWSGRKVETITSASTTLNRKTFKATSTSSSSNTKKRCLLSSQNLNEFMNSSSSASKDEDYKKQQTFEGLPKLFEKSQFRDDHFTNTAKNEISLSSKDPRQLQCSPSRSYEFSEHTMPKLKAPVKKTLNKLTKKEIEESYHQQRLKMLQSKDPDAAEAYCKEMLNRPSVKQIQASEVVVTARKSSTGQFVVDVPLASMQTGDKSKGISKLKKPKVKRFETPWKTNNTGRNIQFDTTIFSDVNSGAFDKFIQSSMKPNNQGHGQNITYFDQSKQNIDDHPFKAIKHNTATASSHSKTTK